MPVAELMPQPRLVVVVAAAAIRLTRTLISLSRLSLLIRGVDACERGPSSVRCRKNAGRDGRVNAGTCGIVDVVVGPGKLSDGLAAGSYGDRGSSYMAFGCLSSLAALSDWDEGNTGSRRE